MGAQRPSQALTPAATSSSSFSCGKSKKKWEQIRMMSKSKNNTKSSTESHEIMHPPSPIWCAGPWRSKGGDTCSPDFQWRMFVALASSHYNTLCLFNRELLLFSGHQFAPWGPLSTELGANVTQQPHDLLKTSETFEKQRTTKVLEADLLRKTQRCLTTTLIWPQGILDLRIWPSELGSGASFFFA